MPLSRLNAAGEVPVGDGFGGHARSDEAIEQFLGRVLSGDVENVAERSALSTMIAILGRTAMYDRKEITWKGLYGTA